MYWMSMLAFHTLMMSGLYVLIQHSEGDLFMTTLVPLEAILRPFMYISKETSHFSKRSTSVMSLGVFLSSSVFLTTDSASWILLSSSFDN